MNCKFFRTLTLITYSILSLSAQHVHSSQDLNFTSFLVNKLKHSLLSNENLHEYDLNKDIFYYETLKNAKHKRPLKNQNVLLKMLKNKDVSDLFYKSFYEDNINKIRIVFCNSYAIFLMKQEQVLHSFMVEVNDGQLNYESYSG